MRFNIKCIEFTEILEEFSSLCLYIIQYSSSYRFIHVQLLLWKDLGGLRCSDKNIVIRIKLNQVNYLKAHWTVPSIDDVLKSLSVYFFVLRVYCQSSEKRPLCDVCWQAPIVAPKLCTDYKNHFSSTTFIKTMEKLARLRKFKGAMQRLISGGKITLRDYIFIWNFCSVTKRCNL